MDKLVDKLRFNDVPSASNSIRAQDKNQDMPPPGSADATSLQVQELHTMHAFLSNLFQQGLITEEQLNYFTGNAENVKRTEESAARMKVTPKGYATIAIATERRNQALQQFDLLDAFRLTYFAWEIKRRARV